MTKRTMVIAFTTVAVVALAIPAVSSAIWVRNTNIFLVPQSVTFTVTDTKYEGELGGVTCENGHIGMTLTPGTTAHVNSYTASASECKPLGALAFFGCTITSIESTTEAPWVAHNTTSAIGITNVKTHTYMHGAFCPYAKLTVKGEVATTPEGLSAHHLTTGTISGTVGIYNGTTTAFIQNVVASGVWHISPSGTFGLTPT